MDVRRNSLCFRSVRRGGFRWRRFRARWCPPSVSGHQRGDALRWRVVYAGSGRGKRSAGSQRRFGWRVSRFPRLGGRYNAKANLFFKWHHDRLCWPARDGEGAPPNLSVESVPEPASVPTAIVAQPVVHEPGTKYGIRRSGPVRLGCWIVQCRDAGVASGEIPAAPRIPPKGHGRPGAVWSCKSSAYGTMTSVRAHFGGQKESPLIPPGCAGSRGIRPRFRRKRHKTI